VESGITGITGIILWKKMGETLWKIYGKHVESYGIWKTRGKYGVWKVDDLDVDDML
jgi:hypothetical protein